MKGGVVVVGETDISGLRLLEAHFRLDWAADGLDLISLNIAPHHLHLSIHIHSPQLHPHLCTELFTTKLLILSPHTRYLKHAVPYTDPITTTLSSHKDPVPRTQLPHKHTSVLRRTTCPDISLPITQTFSLHSSNKHFYGSVVKQALGQTLSDWEARRASPCLHFQGAPG